jgi:hypothetical protein
VVDLMKMVVGSKGMRWVCRDWAMYKWYKLGMGFGLGFVVEMMCWE